MTRRCSRTMFVQLLDAMLIQDDYGTINQIVLKLRVHGAARAGRAASARCCDHFVQKMGEEQRLMRLAEMLKTARPKQPVDITRYLQALDPATVSTLLNALETIELPENRVLVCDVLARFAQDNPQPFVQRLESRAAADRARHGLHPGEEQPPGPGEDVRPGAAQQEPRGEAGGDEHHRPGPHRRGAQAHRRGAQRSRRPGAHAGGPAAARVRPGQGLRGPGAADEGRRTSRRRASRSARPSTRRWASTGLPGRLSMLHADASR